MNSLFYIILALSVFYLGFSLGSNRTELKYIQLINKANKAVLELKQKNADIEREYQKNVSSLRIELTTIQNKFNNTNYNSDERLLKSNARAKYYREQAEACSLKSRTLADHTAKLDRQLTEGIILVEELRELIKLRDEQIKLLGKQLKIDREAINGK